MNWQYISGFFDADGSVTIVKPTKGYKYLQLSFHNNELNILEEIQRFIQKEVGCKGSIVLKKAKKETHQNSYDLTFVYKGALEICNRMNPMHPKKIHRIKIYNEIQSMIPRNGYYTEDLLKKRMNLEELFWKH